MPRVYLSEEERLCEKLSRWIYGELKTRRMSQQQLAREMNMSQQLLSYKLKNRSFTFGDFTKAIKALNPDVGDVMNLIGMEMPRSRGNY